jgi:hypothetical protein
MNVFYSVGAGRVIFVLGIVNLLSVILLYSSCRSTISSSLGAWLMKHPAYKSFSRYHGYIWWVLWPSVLIHAFLAVMRLGWPA